MQLAGCSVQARCLYDSTRQFCRDYLTTGTAAPDALCAASDAAFLTACALNGTPPARGDVEAMDLPAVFQMAERHSLAAITFAAAEASGVWARTPEDPLRRAWKTRRDQALRKNMLLDVERAELCAFLESAGAWYLPLKGAVLKSLYPKSSMRQMADNDILFDPAFRKTVRDFMARRGYEVKSYGVSNHDVYLKPPIYNFEFHTELFGVASPAEWVEFGRVAAGRLATAPGTSFGRVMCEEDFYVYITLHTLKHLRHAGTGLRSVLDTKVYLSAKGAQLDWPRVEAELERLGAADEERTLRSLSEKLFAPDVCALTDAERAMLAQIFSSGTYGTQAQHMRNKLHELRPEGPLAAGTRARYLARRIFPDREVMKRSVPAVARHPALLPLAYPFRIARGVVLHSRRSLNELRLLFKL